MGVWGIMRALLLSLLVICSVARADRAKLDAIVTRAPDLKAFLADGGIAVKRFRFGVVVKHGVASSCSVDGAGVDAEVDGLVVDVPDRDAARNRDKLRHAASE